MAGTMLADASVSGSTQPSLKAYQALAHAFAAEDVDTAFVLMGDGNMYWATSLAREHSVRLVHARHEHSAVAMADGYARKTGKVGVASTTCGPGFTQIMTALTVAARRGTPLVVFVGDTPIGDFWHAQEIDQRPLTEGTGARFVSLRSVDRMLDDVRGAFYTAQFHRCPVVVSVPMDLQQQTLDWLPEIAPSRSFLPAPQRAEPDPDIVRRVVALIEEANRPVIIAGEGAVLSGAGEAADTLARRIGALGAATLRAKGFFDHSPWSLGTAGSFAGDLAREYYAEADLVIGVGASLTSYTTEQGYLFPNAKVIQIDQRPHGLYQGLRVADLHVQGDARATLEAIARALPEGDRSGYRTSDVEGRLRTDKPDARPYQLEPSTIDPREAMMELDRVIPPDWDIVVGVGHFFNFVVTHMKGRLPRRWTICHDFGAIGQALPTAIGFAAARPDGKVVMIEGDGTFLMHIQELEVLRRQNIKILNVILNDGAYSAETHKFEAAGVDKREAVFGRPDFARIAEGFSLPGHRIAQLGEMKALFDQYEAGDTSVIWDVQASSNVCSQQYRRVFWGEV